MKKCFPFLTTCASQLEIVDKRHSNLLSVPDEVMRNSRSIEECFLDANQIKDLPKNFFRLSRVRVLTLSDNELTYIPENIGNFVHLVELDISRNHIESIHYNLKFCNELRSLDISNNPINRLPEGFSSLRNLTMLNLNDISLTELPNDFGNLVVLQKLELRDNCLKSLPNSFAKLQNLELLDLGGNEFQEFPKPVGKLAELKVLCMDNNELQSIPKEIGTLRSLQQLDMSENFLESIHEEIGNLVSLTDFILSQNNLDCLPNNIGLLKELNVLKVDQNKLMSLTSYVGECSSLQELYLTENILSRLPGTIGKLSKLTHLNVDRNNLTAIPTELTRCVELSIMSFRCNQIRRLPDEIGDMKKLHVLDVSSNHLDRLPLSIAQCPLKALWLSENQSQSIVKLQKDRDDDTAEEYLTCYLLPQGGIDGVVVSSSSYPAPDTTSVSGQAIPDEYPPSQDVPNIPPVSPPSPEEATIVMRMSSTTSENTKVRFPDEETTPSNRVSKELPKTRHPKFDRKAVDGHIIPKDTHVNKETKFAPNRIVADGDQSDQRSNGKLVTKRTKKISDSSYKSCDSVSSLEDSVAHTSEKDGKAVDVLHSHPSKGHAPPSMAPNISIQLSDPSRQSADESRLRSHSDAGLRPNETETIVEEDSGSRGQLASLNSESRSSSSASSHHSTTIQVKDGYDIKEKVELPQQDIKQRKVKQVVKLDDVVQEITENETSPNPDVPSARSSREQAGYSSGGEEIDSISRHVGFACEVADNEDGSNLKLIRRDTPHYTKKAKIQQLSSEGVKNEDVVKQIMEKLKSNPPATLPTLAANAKPVRPVSIEADQDNSGLGVQMRHTEGSMQATPTYDQVVSASALARGSNVPPGMISATAESEEVHVVIQRNPNEPMGMSIAGGKGSSPYQPVFVSRVTETGAAHRCGLRVNDKILEVNGRSMVDVEHSIAVGALKGAGNYIDLLVLREVVVAPPPLGAGFSCSTAADNVTASPDQNGGGQEDVDVRFETIDAEVVRDENGLGFSIAGGKGSMRRELCDQRWAFLESIYICKITPNGAADRCKRLQVGDKIIKINGIDVSDARHDQAVVLLSGSEPTIHLTVQRQIIVPKTPQDRNNSSEMIADDVADRDNPFVGQDKEIDTVTIIKTGGQLGLSICGGIDHFSHPFGTNEPGIFISKISPNGAAKACGKLRLGDRILSVNGHDITHATHDEAIVHFLHASNEIVLEVIHEPPPPGLKKLVIRKEINEKLGINIQGGNESYSLNPDDSKDRGIFVTKVLPDGVVYRDGRVRVGNRILEVNGRSFMGISCSSANKILSEVSTQMDVIVCDGLTPEKVEQGMAAVAAASSNNLTATGRPSSSILDKSPGSATSISWNYSPSQLSNNASAPHINANSVQWPYQPNPHNPATEYAHDAAVEYNNNYVVPNSASSLTNEREHLSFRSKRNFFEKQVDNRKNY